MLASVQKSTSYMIIVSFHIENQTFRLLTMHYFLNTTPNIQRKQNQIMTAKIHFWSIAVYLLVFFLNFKVILARTNFVDPNATVSFFFTADPQFGWGSTYSGNEQR